MGRLLSDIKDYLEDHLDAKGLEPVDEETLAFQWKNDDAREWGCQVMADEDADQVMFYSILLDSAPKKRRDEVMRFVTRANYGMQIGNFELDLSDGEVRFKTSVDIEDVGLSKQMLINLVDMNLMLTEMYFDGLMSVMGGDSSAAKAIAAIEDDEDDDDE